MTANSFGSMPKTRNKKITAFFFLYVNNKIIKMLPTSEFNIEETIERLETAALELYLQHVGFFIPIKTRKRARGDGELSDENQRDVIYQIDVRSCLYPLLGLLLYELYTSSDIVFKDGKADLDLMIDYLKTEEASDTAESEDEDTDVEASESIESIVDASVAAASSMQTQQVPQDSDDESEEHSTHRQPDSSMPAH